jgi:hypothetical protein
MAFRLTPHERGFYPLFTRAAENIAAAADELAKLVASDPDGRAALAARVKEAEHAGDELTQAIMLKIDTTFVTPFDREDIYRLASALDDVVDAIEEAATGSCSTGSARSRRGSPSRWRCCGGPLRPRRRRCRDWRNRPTCRATGSR